MATTIAAAVEEMDKAAAREPTDPRLEPFANERRRLTGTPVPAGVLAAGTNLPDVRLLTVDGAPQALSDAVGAGPAVLVLYRGAWCPFCNLTLRTYQAELLPALRGRGVPLIAVSPQAPDGSLSSQEKNELEFAVLSDIGNVIATTIGVLTAPSNESLSAQRQLGLELTSVNGDGTVAIPMPTTAILDGTLAIRWIDVHPDYTTRSEPAAILAALDGLDA